MKAPLSWLKEYTDISVSTAEIVNAFTFLGLEVETVTGHYTPLQGVVVGKVLESRRHPNADRLTVNKIDVGAEVLDVVCGAPNMRAGLTVAVILAGHKLPDGTEIKKSKIRGEVSCGMVCSERELGISEEAQGIMELRDGLKPGEVFSSAHFGEDPVFDIAVLPNRPDCLSVVGLARELSAKLGKPLRLPEIKLKEGPVVCASKVKVRIDSADGCPRYTARHIAGVKIGPSPEWMVKRLRAAGVRAINNAVDVTNFVLMELGHPLHAFDYNRVSGGEIVVRRAKQGEVMKTLDGIARTLLANDLLICDAEKPVALAGVMGGESSEVSDATTEILLESAYFEPIGINATSKRFGLISEASIRFSRGADPDGVIRALDRAAQLIAELSGGTASSGLIDVNPGKIKRVELPVRTSRINRLLGTNLSSAEIKSTLSTIGLSCGAGEDFSVTVPTNRPDLSREADIAEEVARLMGYDKVPVKRNALIDLAVARNPREEFREGLRNLMAGLGLMESVTNSMVSPAELALLGTGKEAPVLQNPLSADMSLLRTSMLSSLLRTVGGNKGRSNRDLAFFEMGRVYESVEKGKQPVETEVLAGALSGLTRPVQWDGKNQEADMNVVRGIVEAAINRITGKPAIFSRDTFCECDGLKVEAGDAAVGRVLSVSGALLKHYDIQDPVCYFEIDLEQLFKVRQSEIKYRPMSKFPPSDRDLAVVTDNPVSAVEMVQTIRAESELVEDVKLFDVFRGKELGETRKSTAFSIRFRKPDRTLTENEVEAAFQNILAKLKSKYSAILR